jgi:hypothetical protein
MNKTRRPFKDGYIARKVTKAEVEAEEAARPESKWSGACRQLRLFCLHCPVVGPALQLLPALYPSRTSG